MKKFIIHFSFLILSLVIAGGAAMAQTPSEFSYQGRLVEAGSPVTGTRFFRFTLFDENGAAISGATLERTLTVNNGIFSAALDFDAAAFTSGANRSLQIEVKTNAGDAYTLLDPRQPILSAPYSIKSKSAEDANRLGGAAANQFVQINDSRLTDARTPTAGSGNYVQNSPPTQQVANFNISGNGFVGGNLGIGTTSPLSKLTVRTLTDNAGLVHSDGTISVGSYVGGSAFGGWYGTYSNHPLHFFTNNSLSRMTITQGGDVGIGTIAPQSKLTLQTPTNNYGFVQTDGALSFGSFLGSASGVPLGGWFGTRTNHPLHFFTNSSLPHMSITQLGRVGIGITQPVYKLDVRGGDDPAIQGISTLIGVFGKGSPGIWGESLIGQNSTAVYGDNGGSNTVGHAGVFNGRVNVIGNLSKLGGSFKIDHPLDPANKYLSHSFVESPDMMNIYNGNTTTDDAGEAVVRLPEYFAALNRDFRYQLTVIGQFAQAIVAEEIKNNQFKIRTDKPGVKVSWMVTGIRQDVYANENPILVEEDKPAAERGLYLYPKGFNQPDEKNVMRSRDLPRASEKSSTPVEAQPKPEKK